MAGANWDWEDRPFILRCLSANGCEPYWPEGMAEGEKSAAVSEFERQIYPVWMGMEGKFVRKEKYVDLSELDFAHELDRAVWHFKPARSRTTMADVSASTKKAATSSKFEKAW